MMPKLSHLHSLSQMSSKCSNTRLLI